MDRKRCAARLLQRRLVTEPCRDERLHLGSSWCSSRSVNSLSVLANAHCSLPVVLEILRGTGLTPKHISAAASTSSRMTGSRFSSSALSSSCCLCASTSPRCSRHQRAVQLELRDGRHAHDPVDDLELADGEAVLQHDVVEVAALVDVVDGVGRAASLMQRRVWLTSCVEVHALGALQVPLGRQAVALGAALQRHRADLVGEPVPAPSTACSRSVLGQMA